MPHRILSSQQRRRYHKRTTSQPSIDGAFKPNHRQNSDLNKLSFNSKTDDSLHNLNSPILLHDTNSTPSALNVNDAEQARVRALEDLQKILAEKKALQGEINVLEMRLADQLNAEVVLAETKTASEDWIQNSKPQQQQIKDFELNEFYDEVVQVMENFTGQLNRGIELDQFSFVAVVKACGRSLEVGFGRGIHEVAMKP
ncbi:hypothetical protein KIW84_056313 [Lathyrus oleraceus]|uniref:Uncharacterized protein n=1 Tax=Pisum sativum TaxID=3888 RepID=A0A9D4WXU0_PEA|nr:hypothetical protein KIW84_056313 [Pisum sativum]